MQSEFFSKSALSIFLHCLNVKSLRYFIIIPDLLDPGEVFLCAWSVDFNTIIFWRLTIHTSWFPGKVQPKCQRTLLLESGWSKLVMDALLSQNDTKWLLILAIPRPAFLQAARSPTSWVQGAWRGYEWLWGLESSHDQSGDDMERKLRLSPHTDSTSPEGE